MDGTKKRKGPKASGSGLAIDAFGIEQINIDARQGGLKTEVSQLGPGIFRHASWMVSAGESELLFLQSSTAVEARGEIVSGTMSLRACRSECGYTHNGVIAGPGQWILAQGGTETWSTNTAGRFLTNGSLVPDNGLLIFRMMETQLRSVLGRLDSDAPLIESSAMLLQPTPDQSTRFWRLVWFWRSSDDERQKAEAADAIQALVADVITAAGAAQAPRLRRSERRGMLIRAMDLIDAHHTEPMDIPWLCRELGVPQRSLCRLFDEVLGMSPKKYLTLRRLHHIRGDLVSAACLEQSISRIAADHGMSHFGRFSRMFKLQFGEVPSQYRAAALGELTAAAG